MEIRYHPGGTATPQEDTWGADVRTISARKAVNLAYAIFKPKVSSTRTDALEFRNDRLQMLLDNFNELLGQVDPESTPFVLTYFTTSDYEVVEDVEGDEDAFVHPQEYTRAEFQNNHWSISIAVDLNDGEESFWAQITQDSRWVLPLRLPLPPRYKNLPELELGAKGIARAIKLAAKGRNLRAERLQRQAHAQGLAELNAHMGRKGLALPLGVLGNTYSFLEPMRPHPEPGHAKRRSAAKSLIARERQERLTSNQMEFLESLSPEDRESAYAMLGGRSKRSKRSKKRTRGRSARKGTRSRK